MLLVTGYWFIVVILSLSHQCFLWTTSCQWLESGCVPFVVDVSKCTLEQLSELLSEVCTGLDGSNDWPPPQETECMAVAALNLLNLQVCKLILIFCLTVLQSYI